MTIVKRRELLKEMKESGYLLVRHSSSHDIYSNGVNHISVPIHLNPCIALRLRKEIRDKEA